MVGPTDRDALDRAAVGRFNDLLIDEVRAACEQARIVADTERGLPKRETPALRRTSRGLEAITREEIDWKLLTVLVGGMAGIWSHMAELAEELTDDPAVEAEIGWAFQPEQRALALWDAVISPMFERYARRQPDLQWEPKLARDLVTDWRAQQGSDVVRRQTIAPSQPSRRARARRDWRGHCDTAYE